MKQIKFNYTFFKGVCVIVLVFGLLFAAPSAMKLYKDNFVYTEKVMATSSSIDIKAETNEDTGKTYYTPIYYGTYHGKKISYKSQDTMSCMPEKGLDLRVKDLKNEFWLNSEQKQFLKDTKARLGTIKILNVNPKNPKDHICIEEEKANITSIVGTCGFSFIYIFFVLLIIWIYSNHPTEREIEKTKKQRELMKENEQDNIEKMMKSFDKELLKEKGKGNEIQDRDKSL